MTPSFSTATASLKSIMLTLAPHERVGGKGGDVIFRMIAQRLQGTKGLLIIDEAQHLSLLALESLRSIHDATACGLVLMGNESVYANLSGRRSAEFAQLFSRVGMVLQLRKTSAADVEALAGHWGSFSKEVLRFLKKIGGGHGTLREGDKTLRLASMVAKGACQPLDFQHIKTAYSQRGGEL